MNTQRERTMSPQISAPCMTLHDKAVEAAAVALFQDVNPTDNWGAAHSFVQESFAHDARAAIRAYLAAMAAAGSQEAAALLAQIDAAPSPEDKT